MELNDNNKKTYIQIIIESLNKKYKVLNELMQITSRQKAIVDADSFDEDLFMETISLKQEQIDKLSELDRGFELVYDRIREDLKTNSKEYQSEITSLKELVTKITDLNIKLQALEKSNKPKLESRLANKRQSIKKSRLSNQTVTNYYKTMSGGQEAQSYFYDKKN